MLKRVENEFIGIFRMLLLVPPRNFDKRGISIFLANKSKKVHNVRSKRSVLTWFTSI